VPLSKLFGAAIMRNNSFASAANRAPNEFIVFTGSKKWRDRIYVRGKRNGGFIQCSKNIVAVGFPRSSARFFHRCALQASKDAGTNSRRQLSRCSLMGLDIRARASIQMDSSKAIFSGRNAKKGRTREEIEGLPPLNSASSVFESAAWQPTQVRMTVNRP